MDRKWDNLNWGNLNSSETRCERNWGGWRWMDGGGLFVGKKKKEKRNPRNERARSSSNRLPQPYSQNIKEETVEVRKVKLKIWPAVIEVDRAQIRLTASVNRT